MANIVQAEFFHIGGEVGMNFVEVFERISDNLELAIAGVETSSGIKTVVRFYDDTGVVTAAVSQLRGVNADYMHTVGLCMQERGFRRWRLGKKMNRLALEEEHQKRRCQVLAVLAFQSIVAARGEVGVEKPDHSFRYAKEDEYYDLLTSAKKAKGVWLFVFKDNHLLSDRNTLVGNTL